MKILHTVIFNLKYEKNDPSVSKFFEDSYTLLARIPEAKDFKVFKQVSSKNNYDYAFSMLFESEEDYEAYNQHEDHKNYVKYRWLNEVSDFLEIDLVEKD